MMFGSEKCAQSTCGINTSGLAPGSSMENFISLSNVKRIGRPLCAHTDSMVTVRCSCRSRPCTKGVAIASSAQAAYNRSPELKLR
jgi:hypothetical protein